MNEITQELIACLEEAIDFASGVYGPNTCLAQNARARWLVAIDQAHNTSPVEHGDKADEAEYCECGERLHISRYCHHCDRNE